MSCAICLYVSGNITNILPIYPIVQCYKKTSLCTNEAIILCRGLINNYPLNTFPLNNLSPISFISVFDKFIPEV